MRHLSILRKNGDKRPSNLTPRDGEEGGVCVQGILGGRPRAKALGRPGAPPPPPVSVWL